MAKVTLALPVYKRFDFFPGTLRAVQAQDHDDLDILISDNGENGPELRELVDAHLGRPYRIRRNPKTVPMAQHFNQLWREAQGEYFALISDDDEIDPDWVSSLAPALDDPQVGVALPRVDVLDKEGGVKRRGEGRTPPPAVMSDIDFVRTWCEERYPYVGFVSNMARVDEIRSVGGYPDLWQGNSVDNALLLKLIVGRKIAYVQDTAFRYRVYEESTGLAVSPEELARALLGFIELMDNDPVFAEFATREPARWREMRDMLFAMTWRTYRHRWKNMYRSRLSAGAWVRAAFKMPYIPEYYRSVAREIVMRGLVASKRKFTGRGVGKAGGTG